MADMMKVAGKTSDNVAKPFLVESDGSQVVSRPWGAVFNTIVNADEIRDTTARRIINDVIDLSQYPINSLRIRSTLDEDVTIVFYVDTNKSSTTLIDDFDNGTMRIIVPHDSSHFKMVTPNELPLLDYGIYLKFSYAASNAPTTGSLSIYHVGKG